MAQVILKNNIRWDRALLKQVQRYQRDGIVPRLADKNFSAIASAVSLETSGKLTFTNKGINYEIVPYEDIGERLDSIMADPALAVRGRDRLYKRIQALNLLGISRTSVMEYLNRDMVHQTHQLPPTPKHHEALLPIPKSQFTEVSRQIHKTAQKLTNLTKHVLPPPSLYHQYRLLDQSDGFIPPNPHTLNPSKWSKNWTSLMTK